jgi:hypothetical protein
MLDNKELLSYAEKCRALADRSRIAPVSRRLNALGQSYTEQAQGFRESRRPWMCATRTYKSPVKPAAIKLPDGLAYLTAIEPDGIRLFAMAVARVLGPPADAAETAFVLNDHNALY